MNEVLINEVVVLDVRGRCGCGTTVWRCNGVTASCTSNDEHGVARCAEKAIARLASLAGPELLSRQRVLKEIAPRFWTVTLPPHSHSAATHSPADSEIGAPMKGTP